MTGKSVRYCQHGHHFRFPKASCERFGCQSYERTDDDARRYSETRRKNTHHNLSIVPLCDFLPLELLRRGNESALRCPLVRREHDSLKHLDALKPAPLPCRVTLLQHQRLYLRVRAQVPERGTSVPIRQRRAQVHFVREDDRNGLRRVWYGMYADVRHQVA